MSFGRHRTASLKARLGSDQPSGHGRDPREPARASETDLDLAQHGPPQQVAEDVLVHRLVEHVVDLHPGTGNAQIR